MPSQDIAMSAASRNIRTSRGAAYKEPAQLRQGDVAGVADKSASKLGEPGIRDARRGVAGDLVPLSAPLLNQSGDFCNQVGVVFHPPNISKNLLSGQQHLAEDERDDAAMRQQRPPAQIIAESLAHYMRLRDVNQSALAKLSGVGQTTISLYLHPERRMSGKSGKMPSPNVTDLGLLATALGIESWQLMHDAGPEERAFYDKIAEAYQAMVSAKEKA